MKRDSKAEGRAEEDGQLSPDTLEVVMRERVRATLEGSVIEVMLNSLRLGMDSQHH
jgi:hypothetical protein